MGPLGHFAMGMAAKPFAPQVPLALLLFVTMILDIMAISLNLAGIEGGSVGNPLSHGLFMSLVWSMAFALLGARVFRDYRAGAVIGLALFSHWVLDLISHPIPFTSFSFSSWQWSYGHPLPPDLPLFFNGSPRMGLGLYNSISAVQATVLEAVMFALATAFYIRWTVRDRGKASRKTDSTSGAA